MEADAFSLFFICVQVMAFCDGRIGAFFFGVTNSMARQGHLAQFKAKLSTASVDIFSPGAAANVGDVFARARAHIQLQATRGIA